MSVGGVAVFPADTVYGLACDPDDRVAVERLYRSSAGSSDKPSAVMFFDAVAGARRRCPSSGQRTREAMAGCCPGRSALLLPNPAGRFPLACGDGPGDARACA